MGFYYPDQPPDKESRWNKYIPRWLKRWWADTAEILMVTRMVFGIILPVIGVLVGFVIVIALLVFLLNVCASAQR